MKKAKFILGLAVMATAVPLLTGCGHETFIDPLNPELISISELENAHKNNPLEITLWTGFGQAMSKSVESVIDSFEEYYPYIKVNHVSRSSYPTLHSAVVNSLPSSSWPNLLVGYPDHFADYISSGIQVVLDPYINSKEYGVDLDIYYEQYMKENQSLLYKADGKPYTMGIPFNKSTEVMVYNKDFFDAFDLEVPVTWDETKEVCKEIINIIKTKDGKNHFDSFWQYEKDGETYEFDFTGIKEEDFRPLSYDSQANFFITMCYQFGGKYTEMGSSLEEGFMRFKNDPNVLEALNYVKDMADNKLLGIPDTWNESGYCSKPFQALKSMMTISSSAGVANNVGAFGTDIAPIPYMTESRKFVISQGTNLAILQSSAEKALASWLFIRFASGGEVIPASEGKKEVNANVNFAISSGYLPVTESGEQSQRYIEYLASEDIGTDADVAKIHVQRVANEEYIKKNWNRFVDAAFVGSSDIREECEKIIPLIINGTYTPEGAIDFVYSRLPEYVE